MKLFAVCVLLTGLMLTAGCGGDEAQGDTLVVYCAHDEIYARQIIDAFTEKTGIPVTVRFDTEATKSLGLTEAIIEEANRPRADVFWNNLLLGTVDLQHRGLLQPYKGEGYARIPEAHKDPQGHWAGFGARLRVYILNTETWPEAGDPDLDDDQLEALIQARLAGNDLSRFAIARPMFGTTLSHISLLWHLMGEQDFKAMQRDWRDRHVIERGGNATTKDLVAQGVCDLGWTDTDDYFLAADEGRPVRIAPVFVRSDEGQAYTIAIPNTVAIIRGSQQLEHAQRFVDFLLSEEVEIMLAQGKARQIPLGEVDETQLTDEVRQLRRWALRGYPLLEVHEARLQTLDWLRQESLR